MPKMLFWGVFVAGFVGCSALGIGPVLRVVGGNWASPPMIAGCVLGVALLGLAAAFALGLRPAFLPSDSAMIVALVSLIGVKVAIGLGVMVGLGLGVGGGVLGRACGPVHSEPSGNAKDEVKGPVC
jgi:hypothetical protein